MALKLRIFAQTSNTMLSEIEKRFLAFFSQASTGSKELAWLFCPEPPKSCNPCDGRVVNLRVSHLACMSSCYEPCILLCSLVPVHVYEKSTFKSFLRKIPKTALYKVFFFATVMATKCPYHCFAQTRIGDAPVCKYAVRWSLS